MRDELRGSLPALLVITAVLTLYIVSIAYMFDPEVAHNLDTVMAAMPDLFAAMTDFMLNYLYGFLFTWMPLLLVMMMVNRMLVRPIDRSCMACLLATPASRLRIAGSFAACMVAVLAVELVLVFALQVGSAEALFPGELDAEKLGWATAGLIGLWLFMAGLCFASACTFKDSRLALWGGGGACLALLLLQATSQAGEGFDALSAINPVCYYKPFELAAGSSDAIMGAVCLGVASIAFFAAGIAVFCRRDLNV
ncbi:MAG: hypothetical protein ACI36T_02795 [Eggerthellaceae bacterium]